MKCAAIIFFLFFIPSFVWAATPNPCGQPQLSQSSDPNMEWIAAWQDCTGNWSVRGHNGVFTGIIFSSKPVSITQKDQDGQWGYVHHMKDANQIYFHFFMAEGQSKTLKFSADKDTHVALKLLTGQSVNVGADGSLVYGNVNLTKVDVPHLFFLTPNKDQILNKGEHKTIEWVSSSHFDKIFISIGRSPYQASYLRDPDGKQAFYIDNTNSYNWDVLKINSACHDFYLSIAAYGNDGSGYHKFTSEIFTILHDIAPGFQCPAIQK